MPPEAFYQAHGLDEWDCHLGDGDMVLSAVLGERGGDREHGMFEPVRLYGDRLTSTRSKQDEQAYEFPVWSFGVGRAPYASDFIVGEHALPRDLA